MEQLDLHSRQELQDILARAYADSGVAAKVFYPERFHRDFDPIHYAIIDKIDNSDSRYIAIAAPRGLGKSSFNNILLPTKAALFHEANYIVPVSCTATQAGLWSENLKNELLNSVVIKNLFGDIKTDRFSKEQWIINVAGRDVCIMPRGAGQKVRGISFRHYRPDLVIVDDLEDPEEMDSEDVREAKKVWFYADLLNCVDRGVGSDWKIIVIGTILHPNSLLNDLLKDPDWDSVKLEICDDNFVSNAPNFMPDEQVRELYEWYKRKGQVDVFAREYRNNPISLLDAAFKPAYFKYFEPSEIDFTDPRWETVIVVDVARTTNMKSSHSAVVGASINLSTNQIAIRDIVSGRFHPDELYEEVCQMIGRIKARVLGVETTGLEEFIEYPLKNELLRRRIPIEFIRLKARAGVGEKGKIQRVRSLVPFYRQGLVYHNAQCCAGLEQQLCAFPRPARWDIADATGYLIEMLEEGQRYMAPADEEYNETWEQLEHEYKELMSEYEEDYYPHPQSFQII